MKYRKGYKYQLAEDLIVNTGIHPDEDIYTQFIDLHKNGFMIIRSGYASDGPSGITIDTKSSMRGAFIHDALYQLLRLRLLPPKVRIAADKLACKIWKEDGMFGWRADMWYRALRKLANYAADPKNAKKIYEAP